MSRAGPGRDAPTAERVAWILKWLERKGTKRNREGMARYGIIAPKSFGVSMAGMQQLVKQIGRDHGLAIALWKTEWHEARILCAFVAEPDRLTAVQMDRWAADFNNWAVCDTLCFKLFDRSPLAWGRVAKWVKRREEFVKRAGFALIASLALHDRKSPDAKFIEALDLIDAGADDDRNFVKKGVSWALRSIGHRNPGLHAASIRRAGRLAKSENANERWIGRDVLRDLTRPAVNAKVAARTRKKA